MDLRKFRLRSRHRDRAVALGCRRFDGSEDHLAGGIVEEIRAPGKLQEALRAEAEDGEGSALGGPVLGYGGNPVRLNFGLEAACRRAASLRG